jgi:2-polyprenyl-3-methyl-5-hydroxy-6-metoxy-1,4-benzoquinol methylase
MAAHPRTSPYDAHVAAYEAYTARREPNGTAGPDPMGLLPPLLDLLGDVAGQETLDAGCGQGYLARVLAARGARVTGIDLSPRLVELARAKDPRGAIAYRVADLSRPVPDLAGRFARIGSYLVLNDVEDHRGFAATLAQLLAPGGRLVLALNNPYAAVVRKGLPDYFASGTVHPSGLAGVGVPVPFYHRTLADYLDAFFDAGLRLRRLVDVDRTEVAAGRAAGRPPGSPGSPFPAGEQLPRFMLLAFDKPAG